MRWSRYSFYFKDKKCGTFESYKRAKVWIGRQRVPSDYRIVPLGKKVFAVYTTVMC